MGAVKVAVTNDQLLSLKYKDEENIRMFLSNWSGLERLSEKGDTVATCILIDLKSATGIDPNVFGREYSSRKRFDRGRYRGALSYPQFISIAYTLVLGYKQEEIAFMLGCSQQAVNQNIDKGIKRIQQVLKAGLEE